ncbi:MAG: PTS sugar transporter subunit IIA [Deltaproteobacteria bacterium]|jgi:mannitol/fructose-specific phosphotransferase system IIA component|nr:PTS sugar transporter subunit IIA [Deltaproteobacteria bacterium]
MAAILEMDNIVLNQAPQPYEDVIRRCGEMLVKGGYVKPGYIDGMLARDRSFSTAIGNHIAIPHGEKIYKEEIIKTGLVVLTYPQGLEWNGEKVFLVVGIAAKGNEHLEILENLADKLEEAQDVVNLVNTADQKAIYSLLTGHDPV